MKTTDQLTVADVNCDFGRWSANFHWVMVIVFGRGLRLGWTQPRKRQTDQTSEARGEPLDKNVPTPFSTSNGSLPLLRYSTPPFGSQRLRGSIRDASGAEKTRKCVRQLQSRCLTSPAPPPPHAAPRLLKTGYFWAWVRRWRSKQMKNSRSFISGKCSFHVLTELS